VRNGRPGTGMQPFANILSPAEIDDVALFLAEELVKKKATNTFYHTAENGWPGHRERYGAAFPFVLGEISPETPPDRLTEAQRAGLRLFRESCTSCHDIGNAVRKTRGWALPAEPVPAKPPASAARKPEEDEDETYDRAATAAHDRPPVLAEPTPEERRGEALYQKACAYCHAADGTGENWIGEFLRPHPTNFTDAAETARLADAEIERAILGGLPGTSMPAFAGSLTAADATAIVRYIRRAFTDPPEKR